MERSGGRWARWSLAALLALAAVSAPGASALTTTQAPTAAALQISPATSVAGTSPGPIVFTSTSQTQGVTVTNTGSKKSAALALSLTPGVGFAVPGMTDHCSRVVLQPGSACTLTLTFIGPNVPSTPQFATLQVMSHKAVAALYLQVGSTGLAAPSSLTATPGNAVVTLSWTAVAGATTYAVLRGSSSGGPFSALSSAITANGYVDTTVVNGLTYFYVVTASNGTGTSGNSPVATASPVAPPSAPGQPSVTPGDGVVSLSWPASAGAASYEVRRGTASGSYSTTFPVTTNAYLDSDVVNGVTYYYVVVALNAGGASTTSPEVSATPMP